MEFVKRSLSRAKFRLGFNPKIEKKDERFIPHNFNAVVIIGADFEMSWAFQFSKKAIVSEDLEKYGRNARENIPFILKNADKNNIPITWATVGHLLLESCNRENGMPHNNLKRIGYFENEYWKFAEGDWFGKDPCTDYKKSPYWYAPDLLKDILKKNTNHEIACHTFSHINCSDEVCPPEVFEDEVNECKTAADKYGIILKSFVHPGHRIGNLEGLKKAGFTSYRTDYANILGYPRKDEFGLWEFKQTYEIVNNPAMSIAYQLERYKIIIKRALKSNTVCYLWFHPSMDADFCRGIIPPFFKHLDELRDELFITNTREYVNWLNSRE